MDREHSAINSLLAEAANLIRREKEATRDVEPTEGYKRGQIEKLKEFATLNGLWIDFNTLPLSYLNKGGENEVFTGDEDIVIKLNNFEYAGDDLTNFFIRMEAHNHFFSNVTYSLIGFAYNSLYEFCAVLVQPYVRAKREATEEEIADYMEALGFEMDYCDEFHNEKYEIFDAVPNNVLYGIDNRLYFIDTQIRQRLIE
ncbi:hypothetical protein AAE250_09070 [Bacteroides sp. GD17]|jgi:hypothetical protein|uniref:putative polyvalent protein kinase domain-containing protein n=1 Tax=Bacteroides sp. GD17 TaxID=3139826 RepID=UPI00313D1D00